MKQGRIAQGERGRTETERITQIVPCQPGWNVVIMTDVSDPEDPVLERLEIAAWGIIQGQGRNDESIMRMVPLISNGVGIVNGQTMPTFVGIISPEQKLGAMMGLARAVLHERQKPASEPPIPS